MTERDKLIAQAEALEWAYETMLEQGVDGHGAVQIAHRIAELRALAAQQPEAVEPVASEFQKHSSCVERGCFYPQSPCAWHTGCIHLNCHPQASAPADHNQDLGAHHAAPDASSDHTAADATVREEGSGLKTAASAVGVIPDLDALVAEAIADATASCRYHGLDTSADTLEKIAQAITDLRAEVERAKAQRDEAWQAFTRLRRAYSMVRYPTLTEELRLLYDAADAVAAGKSEGKA